MAGMARAFGIELDKWHKEFEVVDLLQFKQKIALQALVGVTHKMPVLTGRARGNTIVSISEQTHEFNDEQFDKAGGETISEGTEVIFSDKDPWADVYIQNNLPYINRLEDGWSKTKAPQGMFAVTVAEIETQFL